jgi:hypothetical protein
VRRVVTQKLTDVSEVRTASTIGEIALMMKAIIIPKTSINFYKVAWYNIAESCHIAFIKRLHCY